MLTPTTRSKVAMMIGVLALSLLSLTPAAIAKDHAMETIQTSHDLGYRTNPYGGGWYTQGGVALDDVEHLVVTGSCGEILLEHTARTEVEIAVTEVANSRIASKAHEYLDQVDVHLSRKGNTVYLESKTGSHAPPVAVNYIITLPRSTSAKVDVDVGSIKVRHVQGKLDLRTMTGSIDLSEAGGDVRAWTETGLITASVLGNESGPYRFETTTGVITLELSKRSQASVRAQTDTGMIDASGRLDIEKQDDHHLEATHNGGGMDIELKAKNGAIRITV
jgi:DUF4097 and DUF4098 domain-containing protein YvlB